MSINYRNLFFNQSELLIEELRKILPNNKNVIVFGEKYSLMKKMNSNLILNSFIQYVLPHKKNITSKNEDFFLEGGGQEKLDKESYKYALDIKKDWEHISSENKDIIWNYFNILIIISEKYIVNSMG